MYNYTKFGNNLKGVDIMKIIGITLVAVLSMVVLANTASADVYQIFLYYDNGQLSFDRDHDLKVIRSEGVENNPVGGFRAEVIDRNNKVLHSASFESSQEPFFPEFAKTTGQLRFQSVLHNRNWTSRHRDYPNRWRPELQSAWLFTLLPNSMLHKVLGSGINNHLADKSQ